MRLAKPSHRTTAPIRLRLLQTTDLHGTLLGYDYHADRDRTDRGLAHAATLIERARRDAPNSLLFDCGDFLEGSAVSDQAARSPAAQHPMIAAMNALRYDAITIGNHDLNRGVAYLRRACDAAGFPIVSANLLHRSPAGSRPVFARWHMLERNVTDASGAPHALRIAVTGCLPTRTTRWNARLRPDLEIPAMVDSVRQALAQARQAGCDLTIVLAHSGIETGAAGGAENAVLPLAALDDADIVLGGHAHQVFPGPGFSDTDAIDPDRGTINGKPCVIAGHRGSHIGQIDLDLMRGEDGWRVASSASRAIPLAQGTRLAPTAPPTPTAMSTAIAQIARPAHLATQNHLSDPIGETRVALNSFFSLVSNDLSVQLPARAMRARLPDLMRGTPHANLPMLAANAPFKTGRLGGPHHFTNVPIGPLTRRHISDLYDYPNRLCVVQASGLALHNWLEQSASVFARLAPGQPGDLLDNRFPGYQFDLILGLTYEIDLSQPARFDPTGRVVAPDARRIRNLRHAGAPVADKDLFLVAVSDYRLHGTGLAGVSDTTNGPDIVLETDETMSNILIDYIRAWSPITGPPTPVWRFAPMGGTAATFLTSPLAPSNLNAPGLPALQDLGTTLDGFARVRLLI